MHISKRDSISRGKAWTIRAIAILLALIVDGIIIYAIVKMNPLKVYVSLASGAFGTSSESLKNLWGGHAKVWNFGGVVSLPLFQGGAIRSQVEQAEAGQRAALAKYESVVQSAFADVDNALSLMQESKRQLSHETLLVGQLDDYARLARLQYKEGYSAYSVVLQAEQSLFPEQLSLAQLKATSLTSLAGLYKALGGGWIDRADELGGDERKLP